MSKNYVLNDLEYDNVPLRIITSSGTQECEKEELQRSIEKNRELIKKMRSDERYKELISPLKS